MGLAQTVPMIGLCGLAPRRVHSICRETRITSARMAVTFANPPRVPMATEARLLMAEQN